MQKHIVRNCLAAGALLAAVAACSEQDLLLPAGYRQVTITGEVLQPAVTRTQVDNTVTTDGCTGILWSAGDEVGVFGATTTNARFTGDNSEPTRKTTFTGAMQNGDTPKYAYYPYREDATTATAVPVTIEMEQTYSDLTSIATNDIKAGTGVTAEGSSWSFKFQSKVALLRFNVDVRNVEGVSTSEHLVSIHVEPAEDTPTEGLPAWTGEFTMNLTDEAAALQAADGESYTTLVVNTPGRPVLTGVVEAYACIAPGITEGQKLDIHLETDKHWVSFQVTAEASVEAGYCYDIPLVLSAATEENGLEVVEAEADPVIVSFGFTAERNPGKILDKEAYYDEVQGKTTVRSVNGQELEVEDFNPDGTAMETGVISGCIPYLYDFTLIPTFEVTEGAKVKVNGVEQVSGVTGQDFSKSVTYTVTLGAVSRDYTVTVTNTGLPVVVLTGGGASGAGTSVHPDMEFLGTTIPSKDSEFRETDVIAIYDKENPSNNLAASTCGFRIRGNSTSNFPKKPMAIKMSGETDKVSVLGMPKHKRWCLLASWIDRSLIRNAVAFDIANKIQTAFPETIGSDDFMGGEGTDGLAWNPSGRTVELVLNGVHAGNYFLCEQIKIAGKRLNIQDCYEDVLDDYREGKRADAPTTANCGYLLEFDDNYDEVNKFHTTRCNLPCMAKDEVGDASIWSYVQSYIQNVEDNLWNGNYTAAYEKLDINSVIDYWFVQELAMNGEYRHPKSVYMYKNGEGKLFAGPVWDFDYQTFPNIANINSINQSNGKSSVGFNLSTLLYTQYSYSSSIGPNENDAPYMWYPLLFKDATFKAKVKERWAVVYAQLLGVTATIDQLGKQNALSDTYNQAMWPIESEERTGYSWYIDYSGDERLGTYDEVIENFKTVYLARLSALNSAINGL